MAAVSIAVPGTVLSMPHARALSGLITPKHGYHFTDEEPEAQRG